MSASEALHPVPSPWPHSHCVVVSVLSMALWPPALLALLSWQSAHSAVGYSQHSLINVAGKLSGTMS